MAKVLVVDDSRLTRRLLVSALEEAGHRCVQAADGAEGIEAFQSESFDLVVTDLLMPTVDGFGVIEAVRAVSTAVPVLVLSADIQTSSRERCEDLGATKMLNKPARPTDLIEAVEHALDAVAQPVG